MANDEEQIQTDDSLATRAEAVPSPEFSQAELPTPIPHKIGRHRIIRVLGEGGFGRVYLAHDDDLDRPVAIKVPRPDRISHPEDVKAYLAEARTLARLDHPGIVPVHEAGRTEDGYCFVVSKFVEGTDLAGRMKQGPMACDEAVELIASVAEALHYAHSRHLVHRDVKPANILIDPTGKAFLADFGLAMKDEDFGKGSGLAGTPAYMSPEQARGEGHRVDGRSDVFSLGVVFYELLTGRRPFQGDSAWEVMDKIADSDARPPRQFVNSIPKELERICLRALSKRATERYTTANDMADDLRHYLRSVEIQSPSNASPAPAQPQPTSTLEATPLPPTSGRSDSDLRPIRIVPKGLRSFDEHDADFFLELVPGARDREGLPESIRFWKTRIEELDSDRTFKVGLIYGPSGCGKSSIVKAGLLPRLGKHVLTVHVEATARGTEARLLRGLLKVCPDLLAELATSKAARLERAGLRKAYPDLPADRNLLDSLTALRRGRCLRSGQKVLLIIDQYEQWLFAKRGERDTELVAALRQCDGEHVQAIVIVRDDFWLAASRFMTELEIDLEPNTNVALIDLFDPRHARKVLTAFGSANGDLPDFTGDLSREQEAFLDRAVTDLAQDGKVIPVRLALFAEMVNGKPWTPATLREIGGTDGVGVTFLEETFCSPQANPKHRLHQKAAQAVLRALLPETGTAIKGRMQSYGELMEVTGLVKRPGEFDDLLRMLDGDIRLITPTDPDGSTGNERLIMNAERYYQLTHDYLVPSLRDWLDRKQWETRRGRATRLLDERYAAWSTNLSKEQLPNFFTTWKILLFTRRWDRKEHHNRMLMDSIVYSMSNFFTLALTLCYSVYVVIIHNLESGRPDIIGLIILLALIRAVIYLFNVYYSVARKC